MLETQQDSLSGENSIESGEIMDFNALIWASSLLLTGNNKYQNEFYEKQHARIESRYHRNWGPNRD